MPHGVLFRGGEEKKIRQGFIQDDLLDAVIGLGSNLFYGTGIPACILVLRAKGAKPPKRRGSVLFINADREYHEGRAQNELFPEHIEKIVSAYERYEDVPGFAAIVPHDKLPENDCNLNIRRYADNSPPPEPHDVRAHLLGGVPKAEVEAHSELFQAHGFDPMQLLVERDDRYFDFAPDLCEKSEIKRCIEADEGVQAREAELSEAFESWWSAHQNRIVSLSDCADLMAVRAEFLETFAEELVPVGLLDGFKVSGVVARWWGEVQFDLKTLKARGFEGVVEGWVTTITTALEDATHKADPLDHKLVKRLLPEFLEKIGTVQAEAAQLDTTIKSAQSSEVEENGDEMDEEGSLSEAEAKALKKQLTAAKKKLKALKASFVERLKRAQADLSDEQAQELVLGVLASHLHRELDRYVTTHTQEMVVVVETWWEKYRVMLRDIEGERDVAKARLHAFLMELGYAR